MQRILLSFLFIFFLSIGFTQSYDSSSANSTTENVINQLYDLVTFEPGTSPDWDKVRELFHPDAIIVLRTSREANTVFDLEGFIHDFDEFAKTERIVESGFKEQIIRKNKMVFGDIAHFLVLYEASIPGTEFPPQQGVDSFQLIKQEEGWKIVSIINEVLTPDQPVPKELQEY